MARIINGTLYVQSFIETGNPGEYSFKNAVFNNKADQTGGGSLDIRQDFILVIPATDVNTAELIPGVAHRYVLTQIDSADGIKLDATCLWNEDGDQADLPSNSSYCILTENTPYRNYSLPISESVYEELNGGLIEAAFNIDRWHITDKIGITGIGSTGLQGQTGVQGNVGGQGQTGIRGVTGVGPAGGTGVQGVTGIRGLTGFQGLTGVLGQTGILGQTGVQGPVGSQGDRKSVV